MIRRLYLITIFSLLAVQVSWAQDEDCQTEYRQYCPDPENLAISKMVECLGKNMGQFSQDCRADFQKYADDFLQERRDCREDYLKFCGVDFDKVKTENQFTEESLECVMTNWDDLSPACRQRIEIINPVLKASEDMIDHEYLQRRKARRKFSIPGTFQSVYAEYEEGDYIWYMATIKKKNIKEKYEFCPPFSNQD